MPPPKPLHGSAEGVVSYCVASFYVNLYKTIIQAGLTGLFPPQRTMHLSLKKHDVGSVNEWKKKRHRKKRLYIQRNWTLL